MSKTYIYLKAILIFSLVTVLLTSTIFFTTFAIKADAQPQPYRHNLAVALQNKDLVTTLRVGNDGAVYVQSYGLLNECWSPNPVPISQPNFAPAGAGIAMAKQTKDQLTAITVGKNGALHAFWVVGVGKWEGPVPISPPNVFPPGAPVAMAEQLPNQLTALVIGKDGALHVSWVVGTGKWEGPVPISPPNYFRPGAGVSMAKQTNNILSALAVTNNGALHVSWVVGTGKWNGPEPISQPSFAPPGAPTAMAKQTANTLTGLTVGNNGALHVSWVVGTGKWNGPQPISHPNFAPPGAGIGMAKERVDVLIAMVVGVDGLLYRDPVYAGNEWVGPIPIDGTEFSGRHVDVGRLRQNPLFTPGAPVAVTEQTPSSGSHMNPIAFAVGKSGELRYTFFTDRAGGGYFVPESYFPSEIEKHPFHGYSRDDNKDGVAECHGFGDQYLILDDPTGPIKK